MSILERPTRAAITAVAKWFALPFYHRRLQALEKTFARADEIQRKALLHRLRRCADTGFGRDHQFGSIRNIEDFRKHVCINEYEYLAPYIDRVAQGHLDALLPAGEKILGFACTTGTTGKPKLNPVTRRWLKEYTASWEMWGVKAICDHAEMIGTRVLQLSGPGEVGRTASGHGISMVSWIATRYQNRLYQKFYAAPPQLADIRDSDSKYYTTLRAAITTPVGFVIGITPNNLIRLAKIGDEYRTQLIRDLHDGTLSDQFDVPTHLRELLAPLVRVKRPERARFLENVIERTGSLYPKDYWPVSLTSCWIGGTVGYQSGDLPRYYGSAPTRDLGLVSTEGRHTMPFENGKAEGVLAIYNAFYEFLPAADAGCPTAQPLLCHELKVGDEYSLIMTTSSGLYRYEIGDIVRCTGFLGQAPLLEFLHKTGQYSDMEGEKLSGSQVARAVEVAARELNLVIDAITAVPVRCDLEAPYYALLLERPCLEDADKARRFLRLVDQELIRQNVMYAGKRNDRYLESPRILRLAAGTWENFAKTLAHQRGGDSQYKHVALEPNARWLDNFHPIDSICVESDRPTLQSL